MKLKNFQPHQLDAKNAAESIQAAFRTIGEDWSEISGKTENIDLKDIQSLAFRWELCLVNSSGAKTFFSRENSKFQTGKLTL